MGIGFDADRSGYLCAVLAPIRITRIIDIGANPIRGNPYSSLMSQGNCNVVGFEPHPKAFKKLQKTRNGNTNYLPFAVGAGGDEELKICSASGFTSLLEPNLATFDALGQFHNRAEVVSREVIQTRTLDSIDEVGEFDLLKIDIQGGEANVFDGGKKKLQNATVVITEVAGIPIYVNQPLMDVQISRLRALGFEFHKLFSTNNRSFLGRFTDRMHHRRFHSQFVDGDAVFVRSLLSLGNLETERLKHLSILADGVFDSQDITVAAMTILQERGVVTAEAIHTYIDHLPFAQPREDEIVK